MRKQDRIANQQEQNRSKEQRKNEFEREPVQREQVKGSGSETQRPQRQSGKLPLPD